MAALDVRPHERLNGTVFQSVRHWPFAIAVVIGLLIGFIGARRSRKALPQ